MEGFEFTSLSQEDSTALSVPFIKEEIAKALTYCDSNKSLGRIFLTSLSLKDFGCLSNRRWVCFSINFFATPHSLEVSLLFVALIPKVNSPQSLVEFHLISLLGSLYKLVDKVSASRLASMMDKIISSNQYVFLKGRQLVDGVVVVNQVVDLAKKSKQDCLIFKESL